MLKSLGITSMLFFRLGMFVNIIIKVNSGQNRNEECYGEDIPDDFDEGQYNIQIQSLSQELIITFKHKKHFKHSPEPASTSTTTLKEVVVVNTSHRGRGNVGHIHN